MKKKCMIICFFAILLVPNLLGLVSGRQGTSGNTEKRELAGLPALTLANLNNIPSQTENWINDHAPFRDGFIDAYAVFNMELFHSIDNSEVIIGRDNWLFYTGNESMIDTLGVRPFTPDQLDMILDRLLAVREKYVKDKDNFVFFIAPNKELVYRRYMPDYYAPVTDTSKARELVNYIRANSDIKVVYPLEELYAAGQDNLLYYKTDTHWNNLGGFMGVQELITALGGEATDYRTLDVAFTLGTRGDLGDLGHTPMRYLEEYEAEIDGYLEDVDGDLLENNENGSGVIRASADGAPDSRNVLMVRDSFALAMAPVIMRYFENTMFVEWQKIPDTDLGQDKNDVFIYEVVERNLGKMSMDLDALLEK